MTAFRSAKNDRAYKAYQKNILKKECPFCEPHLGSQRIIKETSLFYVMKNMFPYDVWDARRVKDHLMIVPKRHISSLGQLSKAEELESEDLVASYEAANYNVYSRAPSSKSRSVTHQHTHLVKTARAVIPFLILSSKKPFIRFLK